MSESSTFVWPAPFEPEERAPLPPAMPAASWLRRYPAAGPGELPVVELVPRARTSAPRTVGPGRRERAYLERLGALEGELARTDAARAELDAARSELEERARSAAEKLELVSLLERGAERRLNRTERELAIAQAEVRRREQRENRLILALGALQNENQRLGQAIRALQAGEHQALGPAPEETARPRRGWRAVLARWLGA